MNKDIIKDEKLKDEYDEELNIESLLSEMLEIKLDNTDLENSKIDKKKFQDGIKQMSKIAGMYVCLVNAGMDGEFAFNMIANERNIEHAQKMQAIINETQIKISENQSMNVENHQI